MIAGRVPGAPVDDKAIAKLLKDRQRVGAPLNGRTVRYSEALVLPGGGWTPHDCRRSAATAMQRLGVLPVVIEKCLNHTEPDRLRAVYQRADYLAERRDAFNRLGDHLERLAAGERARVVAIGSRARA